MELRELTCAEVEDEDMDARYLAGTLPESAAAAFEAHYFGCERCWTALQRGLDVRAAAADAASTVARVPAPSTMHDAPAPVVPLRPRLARTRRWWPLAAAATVTIAAVATWRAGDERATAAVQETVRGETDSLRVTARADARAVYATWTGARGADRYRVRLLTAAGTLLVDRETADTAIAITMESLGRVTQGATIYWDIQAIDALRRVIARSGPTPVQLPAGPS